MENPFVREHFRNLPEKEIEEIYRNRRVALPFDPQDLVMFVDRTAKDEPEENARRLRALPYHHRSADLGVSTPMHERIPALGGRGEIHHVYTQIDIKGGGFLFPEQHESKKHGLKEGELAGSPEAVFVPHSYETASGYDFLGLMDEGMAVTTIKRSKQLAAEGMRTESVAGVYRIKALRLEGREVSFKEFRENAVKVLRGLAEQAEREGDEAEKKECFAKIKDLKDAEQGYKPVIEVRLVRSVFRLRDLKDADESVRREMLEEACKNLNIEAQALGRETNFEVKTQEGRERWMEFVTRSIGEGVGIMHRTGLVHMFLHMGNLTLAGEVVDLDSVQPVVHEGKGAGKEYENEPFFTRGEGKYAYIDSAVGEHRLPDMRFGLPKCILKDFRDACFSFRMILKSVPELAAVKRQALGQKIIDGYLAGLGEADPFKAIGATREKLEEALRKVADEIIVQGKKYPPIPTDDEELRERI